VGEVVWEELVALKGLRREVDRVVDMASKLEGEKAEGEKKRGRGEEPVTPSTRGL
jgi:hypothetical protein